MVAWAVLPIAPLSILGWIVAPVFMLGTFLLLVGGFALFVAYYEPAAKRPWEEDRRKGDGSWF
jgi:hypothetical protein